MVRSFDGDGKAVFAFFVGAIIAIVFLASIADSVFTQTTTGTEANLSVTVPAINVTTAVNGRDLLDTTTVVISNATNISLVTHGLNLSDGLVGGVKTVTLTVNDSAGDNLVGTTVNLTYDYNPDGYIADSGGRSIALLITIFGALAILVFGIVVFVKDGTLGRLLRNK